MKLFFHVLLIVMHLLVVLFAVNEVGSMISKRVPEVLVFVGMVFMILLVLTVMLHVKLFFQTFKKPKV